jgi:hypothetical protein
MMTAAAVIDITAAKETMSMSTSGGNAIMTATGKTGTGTGTGTDTADAVTEMRTTTMMTWRRDRRLSSIMATGTSISITGRIGLGSDRPWVVVKDYLVECNI